MPPKKRSKKTKRSEKNGSTAAPAPAAVQDAILPVSSSSVLGAASHFVLAEVTATPVPSLPLADALLFADTMPQVLQILGQGMDRWMEAIVLATPFWAPGTGRLNQPVDLGAGIPPLVAASLRFDPGRELRIGRFAPHVLSASTKGLLATLERIRIDSQFPPSVLPPLVDFMPKLNGIHLESADQLDVLLTAIPHGSVQELGVSSLWNRSDLSFLQPLTSLRKLTLDGCEDLTDISALQSLTELEELSLGGCAYLHDVSPLASLTSLRAPEMGDLLVDPSKLDESSLSAIVPGELLGTYAASLRSKDPATKAHGEVMIRKIVSVDRNPWSYGVNSDPSDIPDDLMIVCIDLMRSPVPAENLHGARTIGSLLDEPQYFASSIVDAGCVGLCVHHLLCDDLPELQRECAQIIKLIAEHNDVDTITSTPHALPNVIHLLCSPVEYCREAAARAIKKIASASIASRDLYLECGVLEILLPLATCKGDGTTVLDSASLALCSCCQGQPPPAEERVAKAVPVLAAMLHDENPEIILSGLVALVDLSEGSPELIDHICKADGCLLRILELLNDYRIVKMPAAACVRNVARGSESQVQALIDAGVLQRFPSMLMDSEASIRENAAESVRLIAANHPSQISNMIAENTFPAVLSAAKAGVADVTKHALHALLIIISISSEYADYLVDIGALQCLSEVVAKRDERTMATALEAMEKITKMLKLA